MTSLTPCNKSLLKPTKPKTIRDFIRFGVSKLREHDVVVAQGTTDEFAEASAIVLQTLSLDWSADEQI